MTLRILVLFVLPVALGIAYLIGAGITSVVRITDCLALGVEACAEGR